MLPIHKLWSFVFAALLLAGCASKESVPPPASPEPSVSAPGQYPSATASQPGYPATEAAKPSDLGSADAPAQMAPPSPAPPPPAPVSKAPAKPSGGSARPAPAPSAAAPATTPPPAKTESSTSASRPLPKEDRARDAREPAPESRPGLGTEWGESRVSRVHDVSFVRDSARPFAVATLHYNDRKGVDAMARLQATRDTSRDISAAGGAVTIAIKDSSGNPLEAVHVGDRTMVVGQAGQRYSIVLVNHTNHRFESVVSVDGLDVVNGKPGSAENRGYVLLPFATLEIEGFRQSAAAVAAFRFAAVAESYAAQTGSARNVGVIGVALFSERGDTFVNAQELHLRDTANPFPADPRFAQPPRR